MINVDYQKLSQLVDSFAVYSERIYEQCEKIKQAQMQLSQFTGFDDEMVSAQKAHETARRNKGQGYNDKTCCRSLR